MRRQRCRAAMLPCELDRDPTTQSSPCFFSVLHKGTEVSLHRRIMSTRTNRRSVLDCKHVFLESKERRRVANRAVLMSARCNASHEQHAYFSCSKQRCVLPPASCTRMYCLEKFLAMFHRGLRIPDHLCFCIAGHLPVLRDRDFQGGPC